MALLIEALTDNRNRTGADVRHALSKHGGSLGEPGSVSYLFDKRGVIVVDASRYDEDDLMAGDRRRRAGHRRSTTTCSRSSPSRPTWRPVREALERGRRRDRERRRHPAAEVRVPVEEADAAG